MSLKQNNKKIKLFHATLILVMLVLWGGLIFQIISLGIKNSFYNKAIAIVKSEKVSELNLNLDKNSGGNLKIGASKGGTKYYYPNCSGLKRIKPENLIFFTSESQAEAAGYSLAANCKKP